MPTSSASAVGRAADGAVQGDLGEPLARERPQALLAAAGAAEQDEAGGERGKRDAQGDGGTQEHGESSSA